MSKQLDYIRRALQADRKAQVEVYRKEPSNDGEGKVQKIKVPAALAIKFLEKPVQDRPYTWKKIYPIGYTDPVSLRQFQDQNPLADPKLLEENEALKKRMAEMEAKLAELAQAETPKRGRKPKEETQAENILDTLTED